MIPKRERGRKRTKKEEEDREMPGTQEAGVKREGGNEQRERERVVIQDLSSQTVTAGLVLLARFKGYRIPRRFCNIATDLPRDREREKEREKRAREIDTKEYHTTIVLQIPNTLFEHLSNVF